MLRMQYNRNRKLVGVDGDVRGAIKAEAAESVLVTSSNNYVKFAMLRWDRGRGIRGNLWKMRSAAN